MSGDALEEALEYAVAVADDPLADKTGRFLQVAGLRFEVDLSRPPGRRITAVNIKGPDGFASLDHERAYKVITYDFVANGGDDNPAFAPGTRIITPLNMNCLELLLEHFQQRSPVNTQIDGRISLTR